MTTIVVQVEILHGSFATYVVEKGGVVLRRISVSRENSKRKIILDEGRTLRIEYEKEREVVYDAEQKAAVLGDKRPPMNGIELLEEEEEAVLDASDPPKGG